RGRQRLRRQLAATADDRGPPQRLQLPREHHQELRRAPAPAARRQVLPHPADQRPSRKDELHADRRRYDEPERSGTLSDGHDDDDRRLPLSYPVRPSTRSITHTTLQ